MTSVEDFEPRPHKGVTFLVEKDKEMQEVRELKVPNASPGYSGCTMNAR